MTEQAVRFQVVRIPLQNLLGLRYRVADAPCACVKFGQASRQILRRRIGFDGQPIFLNGLRHQIAAPVDRHFFFIHVGNGEVVIRRSFIGLVRRGIILLDRSRRGAIRVSRSSFFRIRGGLLAEGEASA